MAWLLVGAESLTDFRGDRLRLSTPCWSRVPSCQSRANLTIGVLYLIQVVNSLLFIVLPVASEKWVPSISGVRNVEQSFDPFDVRAVT